MCTEGLSVPVWKRNKTGPLSCGRSLSLPFYVSILDIIRYVGVLLEELVVYQFEFYYDNYAELTEIGNRDRLVVFSSAVRKTR